MSYEDVVVYLDASEQAEARIRTAIELATRHKARLIGVDVSTEAAFEGLSRERALSIEDAFGEMARAAGLTFEYRATDTRATTAEAPLRHCADLIVTTQPHPDQRHLANPAVPKEILLASGIPMLILPATWSGGIVGRRVVVAWNFSRESTRALHDAMPILAAAESVFVYVYASNYDPGNADLNDVQAHLEHHGVNAKLDGWRADGSGDVDAVSALFSLLDREEADLIVSGAYGHSPFLEDVFGGASATLLNNVSMPVLMSH